MRSAVDMAGYVIWGDQNQSQHAVAPDSAVLAEGQNCSDLVFAYCWVWPGSSMLVGNGS